MAVIRTRHTSALASADLALAVHGPWDVRAHCEAQPCVLHHPRTDTGRLRALWAQHRQAIETEAARAGVREAWIVGRLLFCDLLESAR